MDRQAGMAQIRAEPPAAPVAQATERPRTASREHHQAVNASFVVTGRRRPEWSPQGRPSGESASRPRRPTQGHPGDRQ